MAERVVIGITGASGAAYARRVMQGLAEAGVEIHLTVSTLGRRLLFDELAMKRLDADALTAAHERGSPVRRDARRSPARPRFRSRTPGRRIES